jgi:hypothetical protein
MLEPLLCLRENTTCFLLINVHLLKHNLIVSNSFLLSRLGLLREFLDIVEGAVIEVCCSYIKVAESFVLCCSVLTKCNIIKVRVPPLYHFCKENVWKYHCHSSTSLYSRTQAYENFLYCIYMRCKLFEVT